MNSKDKSANGLSPELKEIIDNELEAAANDSNYLPPLFHGTNSNALKYGKEKRAAMKQACELLIQYYLHVYQRNGINNINDYQEIAEKLGEDRSKISDAYIMADARGNDVGFYDYDDTYLTFNPIKAIRSAKRSFVFGETGYVTYWLRQGALKFGFELPNMTEEEQNAEQLFCRYQNNPDNPVVLMSCGIKKCEVSRETGETFDEKLLGLFCKNHEGSVRVDSDYDFSNSMLLTEEETLEIANYFSKRY